MKHEKGKKQWIDPAQMQAVDQQLEHEQQLAAETESVKPLMKTESEVTFKHNGALEDDMLEKETGGM